MQKEVIVFLLICLAGLRGQVVLAEGTVLVPAGAKWEYQDSGLDFGTGWIATDFDDSAWPSGAAPLGFGEANNATELSFGLDPDCKYITYYFRQAFVVENPQDYNLVYLNILRDDGVVVYLNGQEIRRDNMPGGYIDYLTFAETNVYGAGETTYFPSSHRVALQQGVNVLAVELHQAGLDSIDLNFDLELTGVKAVAVTRGPYLQMRSSSNIVVRWRSEVATDSYVLCGTSVDNLNLAFSDAAVTTEHEIGLSNLQAQTTYYYAVGGQNTAPLYGVDMHFTTAPPTGTNLPVRVWFVSDYGFQNEGEIAVRDSYFDFIASSRPADVWLTGGDNDQWDGSDEREQVSIFEIYSPLLRTTPIWPALGNHDSYTYSYPGPCPLYDNFTLPTNGEVGGLASGTELYFSFDYGNVHFISLNSIYAELSASNTTAMLQWLRQDLAQTRQPWKIAWWHAPPYTKGSHDSDERWDNSGQMLQMRENALPILESYGVDLVLNGHSHVYERSYFLNGHYGYSWDFSETNKVNGGDGREDGDGAYHKRGNRGAVYVVAATGGSPTDWPYGQHPAHYLTLTGQLGSCMVDVNDMRLDFRFFGPDTNVLDHFTIIKETTPPDLKITAVSYAGNQMSLTWDSIPGRVYQVYRQPSLNEAPILIADQIQANGESTTWSGTLDPAEKMGFFLVAVVPN